MKESSAVSRLCSLRETRGLGIDFLLSEILVVEEDRKEDEVRGIHGQTELPVSILNITITTINELIDSDRENNGNPTNHLKNLNGGDKRSELEDRLETVDSKSIIGVHKSMNKVIHSGEPDTTSGLVMERVPAEEENGDMVEPMEEDNFFFAKDEEDSIHEFEKFGVDEEGDKDTAPSFEKPKRILTNSRTESVNLPLLNQSRNKKISTDQRKNSKEKIPANKNSLAIPRLRNPFIRIKDDIKISTDSQDGDFFVRTVEIEEDGSPSGANVVVFLKHLFCWI